MSLTKTCSRCNLELTIDNFHINKKGKFGVASTCKECKKLYHKEWYILNRESRLEESKKYNIDNKDIVKQRSIEFRLKNRDRLREEGKLRYLRTKDKKKLYAQRYYAENKSDYFFRYAERLIKISIATPAWAKTEFEGFAILELYDKARRLSKITGNPFHVDHIVPINSKLVCGLHCIDNLRVITAKENLSKSNHYWPDMPE